MPSKGFSKFMKKAYTNAIVGFSAYEVGKSGDNNGFNSQPNIILPPNYYSPEKVNEKSIFNTSEIVVIIVAIVAAFIFLLSCRALLSKYIKAITSTQILPTNRAHQQSFRLQTIQPVQQIQPVQPIQPIQPVATSNIFVPAVESHRPSNGIKFIP